jgi:hypothetical protein
MKYTIKRLAGGGGFASATYSVNTRPTMSNASREDSESIKKERGSSILDEQMVDNLYKTVGLVSDMHQFIGELVQIESTSDVPYLKDVNRNRMYQLIEKSNELIQTKKY